MLEFAKRLERVKEPQTIKMAKLSRALKAEGKDIIDLSLGEPDFPTPDFICDAATKAMKDGFTKYPPVAGFLDLREAICEKLLRENNLPYSPDQIIVSTGAKQCLANVILSIINPGDEVIIPAPYWVTYKALVTLAEGKAVEVDCPIEQDFKISPAQLEAAISDKTRMFIFSSPCNPTGSVYSKDELAALANVFEKYPNIWIVSDEIYEYINFDGPHESIAQFESIRSRVVIVNGFSKGFAMTGWRLGYIAAHPDLAKACDKFQAQFTSGANAIAQKAAITALKGGWDSVRYMTEAFKERRSFVIDQLKKIPDLKVSVPPGAFYAFPNISAYFGKSYGDYTIQNAEDMSMYLLNEANVTTVQGDAFGNGRCIRISYATSMENLEKALTRMAEAFKKLQ